MVTRKSFVDTLHGVKDVNEHYAFIESCAKRGDLGTLRDLFARTREQCSFGPSDWAPRAVCERIVEALVLTNGGDNAMTALELTRTVDDQGKSPRLRLAAVISKLVAAQSSEVIDRLLDDEFDLESKALILHEAVVRGKLTPDSLAAQQTARLLGSHGHPLSALPLRLLDIESELLLPNYGIGSSGTAIPYGPFRNSETSDFASIGDENITETTEQGRAMRICAVVKNWLDESNGQIEARTFSVRDTKVLTEIPPLLAKLGLESYGPSDKGMFNEENSVKKVFTELFSAASTGGAYNYGEFAAYGRLSAWRSLSGLVGCDENSTIDEIAHRAVACIWCLFTSSSEWYYQVAWDIGIACASVATNELAILAATDTD